MSKTIYLVTRTTGEYESRDTVNLVAFTVEQEAADRVAAIQSWFSAHPRPSFDEVWDEEACEITGEKMKDFICPLDPDHFNADRFEEPRYGYHSVELIEEAR
jgi:hypothetical protein